MTSTAQRPRDLLWSGIEGIYAAILEHPFVTGLGDGTLPRDAFRHYIVQDAHYLRDFARALSIAAARAPKEDWIIMLNDHAAGALRVERSLHETFFKEFGLSDKDVAATPMAPTNVAYTSYLLAVAYGSPFHEALAALHDSIRKKPADARLRRFLFQLLCVLGRWEKALTQLQVLAEMDDESMLLAQIFRPVIACETHRAEVFQGKRTALIFGEPEEWVSWLVQANALSAQGEFAAAQALHVVDHHRARLEPQPAT